MKKTLFIALGLSAYVAESSLISFNAQPMKSMEVTNNNSFSNSKNQGSVITRENYHMSGSQGNLRKVENSKSASCSTSKSLKKQGNKDSKLSKSGSGSKQKKSAQVSVKKESLSKIQQNDQSVVSQVQTVNTQQFNQLGSQQPSQLVNDLLNQSYQSQLTTQSYLPSGTFYSTQYQVPQYYPTQTTQQWSVTPQIQLPQTEILNQDTLYNNMLNQAVSFQTPQPYYTIQVPQVSLQYSGYPTTNIQEQLSIYGNPKPIVQAQPIEQKVICNETEKTQQTKSLSKNKESSKSPSKNKSKISSDKSAKKLNSQKSIDKSQPKKSFDKKKNSSKDVKKQNQKKQVSPSKKVNIQTNHPSIIKPN